MLGDILKLPQGARDVFTHLIQTVISRNRNVAAFINPNASVDIHELGFLASTLMTPGFLLKLDTVIRVYRTLT
jgi:hypothetical protein